MSEEVKPTNNVCGQCKGDVDEEDKLQCFGESCKLIFHYACSGIMELGYATDTWGSPFEYWKCLDCLDIEDRQSKEYLKECEKKDLEKDYKNTESFRYHLGNLESKVNSLMEKYSNDKLLLDHTMLDNEDKINRFAKTYGKIFRVVEKMSELESVMGEIQQKISEKYNLIRDLKMEFFLNDPWNCNEVSFHHLIEDSGSEYDGDNGWYESWENEDDNKEEAGNEEEEYVEEEEVEYVEEEEVEDEKIEEEKVESKEGLEYREDEEKKEEEIESELLTEGTKSNEYNLVETDNKSTQTDQ